ncbi:MAG: hypothetical protein ACLRFK_00500 [Alphaproteobacteria bacterium]
MKNITYFTTALCLLCTANASAAYSDKQFKSEVATGLDILVAPITPAPAEGVLGMEVYETKNAITNDDIKMYIPTSMYVRMGGGMTLDFATSKANYFGTEHLTEQSYTAQIGLGWNLSSYVRTELDFQTTTLNFHKLDDLRANYNTFGGMLYFDLARRYVLSGDITYNRKFVPFMGIGASIGTYEFQGTNGSDGMVIAAPRATFGFNVMLGDLIGVDIAYQYQMLIGNGFGWGDHHGGVDGISNIMATIRANF